MSQALLTWETPYSVVPIELAVVLTYKITNGIEDMQEGSLEMGKP
jgi:hypothetical protein